MIAMHVGGVGSLLSSQSSRAMSLWRRRCPGGEACPGPNGSGGVEGTVLDSREEGVPRRAGADEGQRPGVVAVAYGDAAVAVADWPSRDALPAPGAGPAAARQATGGSSAESSVSPLGWVTRCPMAADINAADGSALSVASCARSYAAASSVTRSDST